MRQIARPAVVPRRLQAPPAIRSLNSARGFVTARTPFGRDGRERPVGPLICRRTVPVHRVLMILALLLMAPAGVLAQGAVKSTHGPWELRCDTPPGAQAEQCVVMQFVTAEDRENV